MNVDRPAKPLVVAHRGASVEYPENTIEAFEAAIELGADAVEFDVRMTADGHAVDVACGRGSSARERRALQLNGRPRPRPPCR